MTTIVIDFETTGLLVPGREWSVQPGITQVGAVKLDADLKEVGIYHSLVNPELAAAAWSEKAIEVTGIGPAQVANSPTLFAIFPAFAEFVRGSRVWTGWNTPFDRDVLYHQLCRYGFEKNFPWPPEEIDAMKVFSASRNVQGKRGTKFLKLGEAYELANGFPLKDAHDAVADVRAVASVLRAMKEKVEFGDKIVKRRK